MILYVCDNNNCNIINLEKLILYVGYNQLIKGYQITKNKFFLRGMRTNKILVWGYDNKKDWEPAATGDFFINDNNDNNNNSLYDVISQPRRYIGAYAKP